MVATEIFASDFMPFGSFISRHHERNGQQKKEESDGYSIGMRMTCVCNKLAIFQLEWFIFVLELSL